MHGQDEHVPAESTWTPNINDNASQPDHIPDNGTWAQQRVAWAAQMWQNRGNYRM